MKPTKHIFLQINTDAIIDLFQLKQKTSNNAKITNNEALNNCLIFSQGAMSMGDPVKNFIVETDVEREIGFTVLPLNLFSRNLLYFKSLNCSEKTLKTIPKLNGKRKPVSFIIDSNSLKEPSKVCFSLELILEYKDLEDNWQSIELCIDPVLQVKQDTEG
jgi:hypothetical protein